jgi:hypothetical protein
LKEHAGGPDKANIAASDDAEPMEDIQSSVLYVSFFCSGIMDDDLWFSQSNTNYTAESSERMPAKSQITPFFRRVQLICQVKANMWVELERIDSDWNLLMYLLFNTSPHCLYPGASFRGTQKSGRNDYDVTVTIAVRHCRFHATFFFKSPFRTSILLPRSFVVTSAYEVWRTIGQSLLHILMPKLSVASMDF